MILPIPGKENKANIKAFALASDSNMFMDGHVIDDKKFGDKVLFSIGSKSFTEKDLANYIGSTHDHYEPGQSVEMIVNGIYKRYADEQVFAYEESQLETKYEDFRNLMQEYHDGILLFDLTDKKVWSKAVNDTVGLQAYYEKNKSRFLYKDRYVVDTYTCADEKTAKAVQKMISSGKSVEEIKSKMNKKNPKAVEVKSRKVETGEDNILDDACKDAGAGKCNRLIIADKNTTTVFQVIVEVQGPQPKDLKDVKGLITAEYQNQLEKDWLAELKAKYPVQVNQATVNTLFK